MSGTIVSETVINCVAETVLPASICLLVQTTGVIPSVNTAGALFDGINPTPQLSVAEATPTYQHYNWWKLCQ